MGNSYMEMKKRHQKEVDAFPLGFAFGQQQFGEMMKKWGLNPETDKGKIVSIGAGGYVQKKDLEDLRKMFARHRKEMKDAITADETGEGFVYQMFRNELANHEYGWTGDAEETLDALGLTWEKVQNDEKLLKGFEKAANAVMGGSI